MYIWPLRILNALTPGQLYRDWEANFLTDMRYVWSSSFSVFLSNLKKNDSAFAENKSQCQLPSLPPGLCPISIPLAAS